MTTFAKWTKPGTNEVRVYVNNLPRSNGAKIFLIPGAIRSNGRADWDMKCFGMSNVSHDELLDYVDSALMELNNDERVFDFEQILSIAN